MEEGLESGCEQSSWELNSCFILLLLEKLVPFGDGEWDFLMAGAGTRPGFRGESWWCCFAVTKRGGEASSQVLCGLR